MSRIGRTQGAAGSARLLHHLPIIFFALVSRPMMAQRSQYALLSIASAADTNAWVRKPRLSLNWAIVSALGVSNSTGCSGIIGSFVELIALALQSATIATKDATVSPCERAPATSAVHSNCLWSSSETPVSEKKHEGLIWLIDDELGPAPDGITRGATLVPAAPEVAVGAI
jgi:hypothetical protein